MNSQATGQSVANSILEEKPIGIRIIILTELVAKGLCTNDRPQLQLDLYHHLGNTRCKSRVYQRPTTTASRFVSSSWQNLLQKPCVPTIDHNCI